MNTGELNMAWADAFVAGLAAAGLRHAVLAPGARSAPLAAAVLRRPEIACEVVTDERVAGYLALGLAKASGRPAAVLCTSGTAAANLLPAAMEARLAAVPLLILTADRPAETHGWGANQTVDQTRLYGSHALAFHALPVPDEAIAPGFLPAAAARLLEECQVPVAGPIHANLPFREPLLPAALPSPPPLPAAIALPRPPAVLPPATIAALAECLSGRPGAILCGQMPASGDFASALAELAERLAAPILAEPLANLRFGPHDRSHVLSHQALFLRRPPAGLEPQWLLRIGSFPVSRAIERWLAAIPPCERILLDAAGRWSDPLWRTDTLLRATPGPLLDSLLAQPLRAAPAPWLAAWSRAEQAAADQAAALEDKATLFEGSVARCLIRALPAGSHCFVGNSLAIRALDAYGGTGAKNLTLHGNRGASGIDGNIATAAGIAAATGAPTAVLVGDQTALHDCGALAALAGRPVVVVIMDNGGGGIFEHLPLAQALPEPLLRRGWLAPPPVDFRALAAAFGIGFAEAVDGDGLSRALEEALADGGPRLLRVRIDRAASRAAFAT